MISSISTGAKIRGVLEPAEDTPVIIEDNTFLGGNTGVYGGMVVRENAVLAPGLQLTDSMSIYDEVEDEIYQGEVPENAVVVPESVPHGEVNGTTTYVDAGIVPKYRDDSTDAETALEDILR